MSKSAERKTPNERGREGKPMSLAPLSFDEAVRKMLATAPPKAAQPKPQKKTAKRK
jgi:hypothetical protein